MDREKSCIEVERHESRRDLRRNRRSFLGSASANRPRRERIAAAASCCCRASFGSSASRDPCHCRSGLFFFAPGEMFLSLLSECDFSAFRRDGRVGMTFTALGFLFLLELYNSFNECEMDWNKERLFKKIVEHRSFTAVILKKG